MQDNSNHYRNHLNNVMMQSLKSFENAKLREKQSNTEQKRYNEERRRSWIQFWIPLIATNLISLSALIVAILAYLKQSAMPPSL